MSESLDTGAPTSTPVPSVDPQALNELNATMRELITLAKNAPQPQQVQAPAQTPAEEPADDVDPADLELMPRAKFAEYMVNKILGAVNKQVVEPINSRLLQITSETSQAQIATEVARLGGEKQSDGTYKGGKYPDFWELKDEMLALAKETPGLSPERLYKLARAENPTKASELDKKHNPSAATAGEPKRVRLNFGGLTPSQTGTGAKGRNMSPSQAANDAWNETVKALGGEPLFGDE